MIDMGIVLKKDKMKNRLFKNIWLLNACIIAILMFTLSAHASNPTGKWASDTHLKARFLSVETSVYQKDNITAAIQVKKQNGWHSYWRVPGDAGLAPRFDWNKSENIKNVEIFWPAPERFEEAGLYTFGYMDEVIFPLDIEIEDNTKPAILNAKIDTMVCNKVCIPQNVEINLNILNSKTNKKSPHSHIIDFARKKVPVKSIQILKENNKTAQSPLSINTVIASDTALAVNVTSKNGFDNTDIFAFVDDIGFTVPPEFEVNNNDKTNAMIKLNPPFGVDNLNEFLAGKTLTIVLKSGRNAIEKDITF